MQIKIVFIYLHCKTIDKISSVMNKTFKQLYNDLPSATRASDRPEVSPKLDFVRRIAKATRRSEITVRQWIGGNRNPDPLVKEIIAKELKTPVNVLFPD